MGITFGDLDIGDMFNTKLARFVKIDDECAIAVMSTIIPIGNIRPFDDDCEVIPLYKAKKEVVEKKVKANRIVDGPHTGSFLGQGFDSNGGLVIGLSGTESGAVENVERLLKIRNWKLKGYKMIPYSSLQTDDIFETMNGRRWIKQEGTMAMCIKDCDNISDNIAGKSRDLYCVSDVFLVHREA